MGFSFSPQFSQRWANTSKLIRQAIATELSDIIRLLQPETDLRNFRFTHPDLIAYIDQLEADLNKQNQSIRPVPQSASPQLSTTEQKIDKIAHKTLKERYPAIIAYEQGFSDQLENSHDSILSKTYKNTEIMETEGILKVEEETTIDLDDELSRFSDFGNFQDSPVEYNQIVEENSTLNSQIKNSFEIQLAESETIISTEANIEASDKTNPFTVEEINKHEAMIAGLEMRIDDYLADNMTRMSEDLKHWLRDEVKRQLAD